MLASGELASDLGRAERLVQAAIDGATSPRGSASYGHVALARCGAVFRLSPAELDVMLLTLAVELSPRVGSLFAHLDTSSQRRRPTVASLLSVLASDSEEGAILATLSSAGHLVRTGLVEVRGDGPFHDHVVRIPDTFWQRLAGLPAAPPFAMTHASPGALARLIATPTTREQLDAIVERLRARTPLQPLVVVAGPPGSGRGTIATALAAEIGAASLILSDKIVEDATVIPHVAREAAWNLAAVVVDGVPSAHALARLAREVSTPILVIASELGAVDDAQLGSRWRADVSVEPMDACGREHMWRQQLDGAALAADVDLGSLAARIPLGPGRIVASASAARRSAGRRPVSKGDIRAACRRSGTVRGSLAHRMDVDVAFDELVVPRATRRELELAMVWARNRASVFRTDGMGARLRGREGLVCLFHGPPGTGKTMAAQVLAAAIDADLLRIDLAQVVDKYIGETEKNLERVFDEAEATGAVLLFDEADALFGKRSEVTDARDRYANIETAFLLQRIEMHRGVCILASNLRQNLDDAFTRRIHVCAEFPVPDREERRRIWELQFSPTNLGPDVDLAMLADRAALTGGDIRNAAATAALLATDDGGPVTMQHLVIGTWRELRKSGRLVAADVFGPWKRALLERT